MWDSVRDWTDTPAKLSVPTDLMSLSLRDWDWAELTLDTFPTLLQNSLPLLFRSHCHDHWNKITTDFHCDFTRRQLECGDSAPGCQRCEMSENELQIFRDRVITGVVPMDGPSYLDRSSSSQGVVILVRHCLPNPLYWHNSYVMFSFDSSSILGITTQMGEVLSNDSNPLHLKLLLKLFVFCLSGTSRTLERPTVVSSVFGKTHGD